MTSELKQEFTLRISQANSTDLVVILYEMLLQYLEEGKAAIEQQNMQELAESINRARGCVNELLASVNPEYEIGLNLSKLYFYCIRRLANCQYSKQEASLEDIKRVIEPLCGAYRELAKQNTSGPVMGNSQSVYAGLTYGRNALTENLSDSGSNRGMFA